MKKILLNLIILLVISPYIVSAKESTYTVNLYEYNSLYEVVEKDRLAIQAAIELGKMDFKVIPIDDQYDITITSISTNKPIFTGRCYDFNFNCSSFEDYFDTLTLDDSIEYDTEELSDFGNYFQPLLEHDKIIINFSKEYSNKVFISSYSLVEKTPSTTTYNEKIQDLKMDIDLKFTKLNDYALYKLIVDNTTNKDFQIDNDTIYGKDDIIKYEFSFNDDNIIKQHSKKEMYVKVSYNSYVDTASFSNRKYNESISVDIPITDGQEDIINPPTSGNILIIIVFIILTFLLVKKSISKLKIIMIIISLFLIPISIKAIDKISITIQSGIEIVNVYEFCLDNNNCYEYDDGMTWEEWLNSEYNNNQLFYNEYSDFIYVEYQSYACGLSSIYENVNAIFDSDNNSIKKSDKIKNQHRYKLLWKNWLYDVTQETRTEPGDGIAMC